MVLRLLKALGLVDVILHSQGSVREHLVEEVCLIGIVDLLLGQGLLLQELLQLGWAAVLADISPWIFTDPMLCLF